jgi:lipoyl(octanoyl) transferase
VRPLDLRWLGSTSYPEATRLQQQLVASRRGGEISDTLLLLEHPPVITFGRGADPGHVLAGEQELKRRGIEIHDAGRGGDVTYHGPGQLVGYPIVALEGDRRDAHRYLRAIEQALIEAVAEFGVTAGRVDGLTGVWVGEDKLAAIGVRLSTGWITSHGFALNVHGDLSGFETIVPCGIRDRGVTSLARLTGRHVTVEEAAECVAPHVARVLGLRVSANGRVS